LLGDADGGVEGEIQIENWGKISSRFSPSQVCCADAPTHKILCGLMGTAKTTRTTSSPRDVLSPLLYFKRQACRQIQHDDRMRHRQRTS
jgi:hypothetical protein